MFKDYLDKFTFGKIRQAFGHSKHHPGFERCLKYTIHTNDALVYRCLYQYIFVNRIYHFEARSPAPVILDLGSNIGMSILYFKHIYPNSRIIGFEPDPGNFTYLQENVSRNKLRDVRSVQAAVSGREGALTFYSDGKDSGYLAGGTDPGTIPEGFRKYEVPSVRLRNYLNEPVDFLKINIEGAECEVLADSQDRLSLVREMVIEYHHLPGLTRTLPAILDILTRRGFEYIINNDFGTGSNRILSPPFNITAETRYFLLIYAKRLG